MQLYDMRGEPGETTNLHDSEPTRAKELLGLLKRLVADGRNTPGAAQQNDVAVYSWKLELMPSGNGYRAPLPKCIVSPQEGA